MADVAIITGIATDSKWPSNKKEKEISPDFLCDKLMASPLFS